MDSTRMKFGILAPSTNTVVQLDLDALRSEGVTHHHGATFGSFAPGAALHTLGAKRIAFFHRTSEWPTRK